MAGQFHIAMAIFKLNESTVKNLGVFINVVPILVAGSVVIDWCCF